MRYEDLLGDTENSLNEILCALDMDVESGVIKQAVELFSFNRLKTIRRNKNPKDAFYRKGLAGDWRNYFRIMIWNISGKMRITL